MFRLHRLIPAIALLALAPFASADSLRLLAPAQGVTLRGGSLSEVRWSATQLPGPAEEWEAFLSVNGGKYYAFRITPHLDIELGRFTFVVPNVETQDARILIRVGDEKRETEFESDTSFSIASDFEAEPVVPQALQVGRGEAAREGGPAVLSWTEGARNGTAVRQRSSMALPTRSVHQLSADSRESSAELAQPGSFESAPPTTATQWLSRVRGAHRPESLRVSADLLLTCRRRNV